jgi:hypothetical protein
LAAGGSAVDLIGSACHGSIAYGASTKRPGRECGFEAVTKAAHVRLGLAEVFDHPRQLFAIYL